MSRVSTFLPPLRWLRTYDRADLRADAIAGLTVAVMLVPQSMAYAALAGMPAVAGLYAATVPLVAYALLGTSGQLAFGPVAIVALLTASALAPLAGGDPALYVTLAALLALLVGAIQLGMGALRLGALVNFLSHSVISGFTSAAAIVIALSQARELFGVDMERSESVVGTVSGLVANLGTANLPTILISAGAIALLVVGRRRAPRLPMALVVVGLATAVTVGAGLADAGVAVLGEVPAGLPAPALPAITTEHLLALLGPAFAIALISYMEGISVAKAIAARTREEIDANQELIASGVANMVAGVFRGFPVAGGFSRTAVNFQAGARTPMASLVTAAVVALAVSALTPLFTYLPRAVLAAIIVVAVAGLVDVEEPRRAWHVKRPDALSLVATFLGTLLIGVEPGLALGVALSLALFVWRSANPHTAELGRVEGTGLLRNIDRYPTLTDPETAVLRIDGPLYFANAKFVEDRMLALPATRPDLRAVVLDCSAVTDIDSSGEHTLRHVAEELDRADVQLHLATVRGPVRDVLERSGLWTALGHGRLHATPEEALEAAGLDQASPLRSPVAQEQAPQEVY
jgi:sulfate permease, SulP family